MKILQYVGFMSDKQAKTRSRAMSFSVYAEGNVCGHLQQNTCAQTLFGIQEDIHTHDSNTGMYIKTPFCVKSLQFKYTVNELITCA